MANILLLETATHVCSVGLALNGNLMSLRESFEQRSHAELITVFIDEIMHETGIPMSGLDAVAVSMGPGSYTGLRIGVSTAKGVCYALDKPLVAIDTLQAMAAGMASERQKQGHQNEWYCPMIDARRMEVYAALFDGANNRMTATEAIIIDAASFDKELREHKLVFFGDGAPKCRELLDSNDQAVFIDDFNPSVKFMGALAQRQFDADEFADTAYFEPFYLKDFVAAPPKVKGLRM
jgi:tRNA threonylcarbamoyladenosine biosynthesis protein TsaB